MVYNPDQVTSRILLPGDASSSADPPSGCKFHPRCRYAQETCSQEVLEWRACSSDYWVACHFAEELSLNGIVSQ